MAEFSVKSVYMVKGVQSLLTDLLLNRLNQLVDPSCCGGIWSNSHSNPVLFKLSTEKVSTHLITFH